MGGEPISGENNYYSEKVQEVRRQLGEFDYNLHPSIRSNNVEWRPMQVLGEKDEFDKYDGEW